MEAVEVAPEIDSMVEIVLEYAGQDEQIGCAVSSCSRKAGRAQTSVWQQISRLERDALRRW